MPGAVARTSTFALNNATLPFILSLADKGPAASHAGRPAPPGSVIVIQGGITHPAIAAAPCVERPKRPLRHGRGSQTHDLNTRRVLNDGAGSRRRTARPPEHNGSGGTCCREPGGRHCASSVMAKLNERTWSVGWTRDRRPPVVARLPSCCCTRGPVLRHLKISLMQARVSEAEQIGAASTAAMNSVELIVCSSIVPAPGLRLSAWSVRVARTVITPGRSGRASCQG